MAEKEAQEREAQRVNEELLRWARDIDELQRTDEETRVWGELLRTYEDELQKLNVVTARTEAELRPMIERLEQEMRETYDPRAEQEELAELAARQGSIEAERKNVGETLLTAQTQLAERQRVEADIRSALGVEPTAAGLEAEIARVRDEHAALVRAERERLAAADAVRQQSVEAEKELKRAQGDVAAADAEVRGAQERARRKTDERGVSEQTAQRRERELRLFAEELAAKRTDVPPHDVGEELGAQQRQMDDVLRQIGAADEAMKAAARYLECQARRVALEEDFHLSFPMVFDWNGEVWMIPETGSDHSLRLYRCKTFPTQWELVQRFPTDEELCDTILLDRRAEALTLLCSETRPDNQLYVRYRRYTLRHAVQETAAVPLPAEDTLPAAPGPFELLPDEAYNLQHRDFDLVSRNAGPFFLLGEQIIHPTQVSTTVDYGVYLQFLARRGSSEVPLCAATPQNVEITGLAPADIIGIHTYCRDDVLEIIDARYLTRLPKIETAVESVSEAKP